MRNRLKRMLGKLNSNRGVSLTEMLAALLIMSLVTLSIAGGVDFAAREYDDSMILSESRILCSTLTTIIRSELSETKKIYVYGDDLDSFQSNTYANAKDYSHFYSVDITNSGTVVESGDGYGLLYLGTKKGGDLSGHLLLNKSSYSKYDLKAHIDVKYDSGKDLFKVTLKIKAPNNTELVNNFDVIPLNTITVDTV